MGVLMQKEVKQRIEPKNVRGDEAKEPGQGTHGRGRTMDEEVQQGTCLGPVLGKAGSRSWRKLVTKEHRFSHPQKHMGKPAKARVSSTRNRGEKSGAAAGKATATFYSSAYSSSCHIHKPQSGLSSEMIHDINITKILRISLVLS